MPTISIRNSSPDARAHTARCWNVLLTTRAGQLVSVLSIGMRDCAVNSPLYSAGQFAMGRWAVVLRRELQTGADSEG